MTVWWNSLTSVQQIFAYMAIPATVLLILQTILLIFGLGGGSDADTDCDCDAEFDADGDIDCHHDSDTFSDSGLRIFTVRAFVAFFTVFGWCGITLTDKGVNLWISILISAISGFLIMLLIAYIFKWSIKLQSEGNLDSANAIGKNGTVYLTIPEQRNGRGKVMVTVQERLTELEAVTDCEHKLKTGSEITVVSVSNQGILCVIPKK